MIKIPKEILAKVLIDDRVYRIIAISEPNYASMLRTNRVVDEKITITFEPVDKLLTPSK